LAGLDDEIPITDEFITLKVNMLNQIRMDFIIASKLTDNFVDFCYGVTTGDKFFVRHPYKVFVLFESTG